MNQIRNYVEAMFSALPKTRDIVQMKLDMLESLEDRFQDLLSEGKSENEAVGIVLATAGTAEELCNELGILPGQSDAPAPVPEPAPDPELMREYLHARGQWSIGIAIAVTLFILSPFLYMAGNDLVNRLGLFLFLGAIAVGVAICIFMNFRVESYQEILGIREKQRKQSDASLAGLFAGIAFPLAAVVYLAIGFVWHAWHPGWIIFVLCAMVTGAIGTYEAYREANSEQKKDK